jgi:hypothetical protein
MFIYIHILSYYKLFRYFNLFPSIMLEQIQVKEQFVVRKNMDVNEHETIQHYTRIQIQVKEQLVVRKNMDVNEHERLSNIILGLCIYIHILSYYKLFLYLNLCPSVMLDSLSFSFTSIFFLTTSCSFT